MLGSGLGRLRLCPVCEHTLQSLAHGGGFLVVVRLPLLQSLQLLGQPLIFLADGLHQRLLFLPVPFHVGPQLFQVLSVGDGRGALGIQGRFPGSQLCHMVGDGIGGLGGLGLAALQLG